ncbi:hypothetical protein Ppa06_38780 [Planomonospora parontospora subsp. parontospora]|uniref:Uncharacterized protein n=2 Tax=Planomonospora parontospora TaxID=58119 RepID=A0AA37F5L8_9ACTN|nr:hypothetical protein [Planomonospora parontospora]GGK76831.1 hypothetical protein GCM10010126_40130 [Planomonospora parontospora]GII10080.1 hypothetical protein Ppa06_38780 [Planomonospora parontospora subsp. parontospora]
MLARSPAAAAPATRPPRTMLVLTTDGRMRTATPDGCRRGGDGRALTARRPVR